MFIKTELMRLNVSFLKISPFVLARGYFSRIRVTEGGGGNCQIEDNVYNQNVKGFRELKNFFKNICVDELRKKRMKKFVEIKKLLFEFMQKLKINNQTRFDV